MSNQQIAFSNTGTFKTSYYEFKNKIGLRREINVEVGVWVRVMVCVRVGCKKCMTGGFGIICDRL